MYLRKSLLGFECDLLKTCTVSWKHPTPRIVVEGIDVANNFQIKMVNRSFFIIQLTTLLKIYTDPQLQSIQHSIALPDLHQSTMVEAPSCLWKYAPYILLFFWVKSLITSYPVIFSSVMRVNLNIEKPGTLSPRSK